MVWLAAALVTFAVIVAAVWLLAPPRLPSAGPTPSGPLKVPEPAPAKSVQGGEVELTIERAAPHRQQTLAKPRAAPPANVSEYLVVRGDTLWAIAHRYLGNPYRYPELVRDSGIRNPDLIHPGDIVKIEPRNAKR